MLRIVRELIGVDSWALTFDELREKVYRRVTPTDTLIYSRYRTGGSQDPLDVIAPDQDTGSTRNRR
jgi:hypothetical protein